MFDLKKIDLKFSYLLNLIKPKGWVAYEYNPFHNLRLSNDLEVGSEKLEAGTLIDLDTEKLNFSLHNPIDMICLPSYDGSVNLILNDNRNVPKLINSRFSIRPENKYEIVDRVGNTDTNLYDTDTFSTDTSLYKIVNSIPKILFRGLGYNGDFKVGNYVFYFKLSDADGNESDFIGESGIVSCYIGNINDPESIKGGISDENSNKTILFLITGIDNSYDYLKVYYTRSTSSPDGAEATLAFKIDKDFPIINGTCELCMFGTEVAELITIDDINISFFLGDSIKTQAVALNMLFFGNVHKPAIDYLELKDLSLRLLPFYEYSSVDALLGKEDGTHSGGDKGYYNASNIYYKTGYWDREIYKLGVVWLMQDGSLSPAFSIRGRLHIPSKLELMSDNPYTYFPVYKNTSRNLININSDYTISSTMPYPENAKGAITIEDTNNDSSRVYNLGVYIDLDVFKALKGKVKGFFIVRLKRTPLVLCLALTMGYNKSAGIMTIPCLNASGEYLTISESFIPSTKILTLDYNSRIIQSKEKTPLVNTAICPEYDLNLPYFNNLFTGTLFPIGKASTTAKNNYLEVIATRHYHVKEYTKSIPDKILKYNISALGDNTPLIRDLSHVYRGRCGEAEDASKLETLDGDKAGTNLVRGIYAPYLAISDYKGDTCDIVNIYRPDYDITLMSQYFLERYQDDSAYYAISERIDINTRFDRTDRIFKSEEAIFVSINSIFRGDCFVCDYTHRINRNFQDPIAPTNDTIVDPNTWLSNYKYPIIPETNAKINRGDINAIQLGSWVTFRLRSNTNLCLRTTDDSYTTEQGLTGLSRSFFPLLKISAEGTTKIPESFLMNKGLNSTTSDKYNYILPGVPYIKNLFSTRIAYSDVTINDAFKNGFRVFQANHFRDYPMTYGGIVKLVELYGNLLCVFEHGVAIIPVNERVQSGDGAGGFVYINTNNILPENPRILSDSFGTLWQDSIVKTPYYVYGVDTTSKKIWRTNGSQFDVISDFTVLKFLIDNISLSERELSPTIGVRNVKSHYNAYKNDIMFTFYDNLYGFEEKSWNLCWNEVLQKWITLYSWIPSVSENIDNMFFSFDRDTSKWISKLGICNLHSNNADGIVLDNPVFTHAKRYSKLFLVNRALPNYENSKVTITYKYSISDDLYKNSNLFSIELFKSCDLQAYLNEKFDRFNLINENLTLEEKNKLANLIEKELLELQCLVYLGDVETLTSDERWQVFIKKPVWQVNVKVDIVASGNPPASYINSWKHFQEINSGYYSNVITVTSSEVVNNLRTSLDKTKPNLTTDFWKHGQGGLIDIKEEIKPCFWYGKLHPFEFEFIVNGIPGILKIFNNLLIISNKAAPESIHYEIIGEGYEFSEDKENIYARQELTKELYLNLSSNILYDRKKLAMLLNRGLRRSFRSTVFPWYYERIDTINEIYDSYLLLTSKYFLDYLNLSGTEVVLDTLMNEYRLLVHLKICDIFKEGRLRGNSLYNEDLWIVQIPSINFILKNEVLDLNNLPIDTPDWRGKKIPPIVLNNIPNDIENVDIEY